MMDAMERAVARGVRVKVIMAGEADTNLDRIVRKASQGMFGRALEAGIKIHEYRGALLHAKTITVDGRWSSVGSANLDRRSFALNHELNIAFDDPASRTSWSASSRTIYAGARGHPGGVAQARPRPPPGDRRLPLRDEL